MSQKRSALARMIVLSAVTLAWLSVPPVPCFAADSAPYEIGIHLRVRYEDKQDFNFLEGSQSYGLTRLRLAGKVRLGEGGSYAFLELQDARVHGEDDPGVPAVREEVTPNFFVDELDVHQGYLFWRIGERLGLKVGRQKFNLGDKRLVASLEWANTARVFDGVRFTIGDPKARSLDVIASQPVTVNPDDPNDWARVGNRYFDSEFYALYFTDKATIDQGSYELFLFHRRQDELDDEVWNLGGRLTKKFGPVTWDLQGSQQFGDYNGLDHQAHAFVLAGSYAFATKGLSQVGVAYIQASGDGDALDGDHETFDNLYPLNHANYGYMDFFGLPNLENWEVTLKGRFARNLQWRLAWHRFSLVESDQDAWYSAGLAPLYTPIVGPEANEDHAGDEVDFTLSFPILPKKITVALGYSRFLAGDYLSVRGRDTDADFWFVQGLLTWNYRPTR